MLVCRGGAVSHGYWKWACKSKPIKNFLTSLSYFSLEGLDSTPASANPDSIVAVAINILERGTPTLTGVCIESVNIVPVPFVGPICRSHLSMLLSGGECNKAIGSGSEKLVVLWSPQWGYSQCYTNVPHRNSQG